MQAAGHLVAVVVELAARVQLGHHDLGRRALPLVVVLDVGRDAAAVVDHRDRVVGVDHDLDVVAEARERLVDRVVEHLEHHVVQSGAIGRVADVHARTLADGVEPLQDLDAVGVVFRLTGRRQRLRLIHSINQEGWLSKTRRRLFIGLDPHRHHDVLVVVATRHRDQRTRVRIAEREVHALAREMAEHVDR